MDDRRPAHSSQFSLTLGTKLVLSMAVVLTMACLLLGGIFIRQQVRSNAESLVQSGTLLAQHLARTGRFSIVANDKPRLEQLIQEVLAFNSVTYVAIISSEGDLQVGAGKEAWAQHFLSQPMGRRSFSLSKLILPRQLETRTDEPLINAVYLDHDGPALRPQAEFTLGELLSLVGGSELPISYDVIVRVPQRPVRMLRDPALQLTLDERLEGSDEGNRFNHAPPTLVEVGLSTSNLQHILRRLVWQATVVTVSTIAAGLLVAVFVSRRMTTPLEGLASAANKLSAGEAVLPIAISTGDEIGALTRVFNTMASTLQSREHELRELAHTLEVRVEARTKELAAANVKLQELDRRKTVFVSTASHELRTPLTSMKVHLANLRDGIDGAVTDEQRQSLSRVEANLSRLQTLLDELLDLSQIEMGQVNLRLEPVALGSVIAKTVEDLRPVAVERRVRIVLSMTSDLSNVWADPDKLHQIILNLAHNAVKFAPTETVVEVSATRLPNDLIRISVRDEGPGIALEDVEKVFQPFYRAPTVHKQVKGAGLGLAITKLLVELHHGRLWVETVPGRGSCFSFTLSSAESAGPALTDASIPSSPNEQTTHR